MRITIVDVIQKHISYKILIAAALNRDSPDYKQGLLRTRLLIPALSNWWRQQWRPSNYKVWDPALIGSVVPSVVKMRRKHIGAHCLCSGVSAGAVALTSGCSWCKAAQEPRHSETAGCKTLRPHLTASGTTEELGSIRAPPPPKLAQEAQHREAPRGKWSCSTAAFWRGGGRIHSFKGRKVGKGREGNEVKGYSIISGRVEEAQCMSTADLWMPGCLEGGFGAINTGLSFTGRTEEEGLAHGGCDSF